MKTTTRTLYSPYDNRVVGEVPVTTRADAERAIAAAHAAFPATRALPAHTRHRILMHVSGRLTADREALAQTIVAEAGKPLRDARAEVDRAALVFSLAAEEARRGNGEVIPLDINPVSERRLGLTRRFPVGAVAALTPFNFPLNLAAHKVAPAIACGAPVVLKPAEKTPLIALKLAEILAETELPAGAFHVLTPETPQELGDLLATDPRLPVFSFTGSDTVGWMLKEKANRKRVLLELGGNAAVIVHHDADIVHAAARCVVGAFTFSGQVCISVQRIFVQKEVFAEFVERFVSGAQALVAGDPASEATQLGPLISTLAADRVEAWIDEAMTGNATPLLRGGRTGNLLTPTILTSIPPTCRLACDEVFGPVAVVEPYDDFADALARANDSRYGLQAGVFTQDVGRIFTAFSDLNVGGVIANDVPQYRVDHLPYGGEKDSGFGREGVRYAMDEMTTLRVLALAL